MIPLNDKVFTALDSNTDILFFELSNNTVLKAFAPDINKEDKVVLAKLKVKNPKNIKDFENFKKKILSEEKIVIVVEDV